MNSSHPSQSLAVQMTPSPRWLAQGIRRKRPRCESPHPLRRRRAVWPRRAEVVDEAPLEPHLGRAFGVRRGDQRLRLLLALLVATGPLLEQLGLVPAHPPPERLVPDRPRPRLVPFERRGLALGGVEGGSDPPRPGLDGR